MMSVIAYEMISGVLGGVKSEQQEATAVDELIMDKIQQPAGIRPGLDKDRRPRANGTAAVPALAHFERHLPLNRR